MAQGICYRKEFMKRKQLDRHTTQWKWRKLAPLTLQMGGKFRIVHPLDWYMYYRIVFLLGQYVKHVTCITVWNSYIEKALEFFLLCNFVCNRCMLQHSSFLMNTSFCFIKKKNCKKAYA
jgi:hypothetical protein